MNNSTKNKQEAATTSASKSSCAPSPDSGSAMVTLLQILQICHQDPHPHGNPELPPGKGKVDKQTESCDHWKRCGILYLRRGTGKWICEVSGRESEPFPLSWAVKRDGEREIQNGHKVSSLSTKIHEAPGWTPQRDTNANAWANTPPSPTPSSPYT